MDPPVTGYDPEEPVRLRPEACASGIEPGYCVPGWCLDNAGDPMCEEPCTADSVECGVPGLPTTDVCDGDTDSTCTPVDPAECVPGPAVDCVLVDPVPETTVPVVVCDDTIEVPVDPQTGLDVSQACVDPGIVCADAPVDAAGDDTIGVAPECVGPPVSEPMPPAPEPVPVPEPEPTVITVTGVERTATVTWGVADGVEVQYLVPAYRFSGTFPDGSPWSTELVAVSDDLVVPPGEVEPPTTVTTSMTPSTDVPEPPTCSNETPEACAGSLATTSLPAPCDPLTGPDGEVLEEGAERLDTRCIPTTTIPGDPVTTVPPTTVDDLPPETSAG
jgi:hypothetical protein